MKSYLVEKNRKRSKASRVKARKQRKINAITQKQRLRQNRNNSNNCNDEECPCKNCKCGCHLFAEDFRNNFPAQIGNYPDGFDDRQKLHDTLEKLRNNLNDFFESVFDLRPGAQMVHSRATTHPLDKQKIGPFIVLFQTDFQKLSAFVSHLIQYDTDFDELLVALRRLNRGLNEMSKCSSPPTGDEQKLTENAVSLICASAVAIQKYLVSNLVDYNSFDSEERARMNIDAIRDARKDYLLKLPVLDRYTDTSLNTQPPKDLANLVEPNPERGEDLGQQKNIAAAESLFDQYEYLRIVCLPTHKHLNRSVRQMFDKVVAGGSQFTIGGGAEIFIVHSRKQTAKNYDPRLLSGTKKRSQRTGNLTLVKAYLSKRPCTINEYWSSLGQLSQVLKAVASPPHPPVNPPPPPPLTDNDGKQKAMQQVDHQLRESTSTRQPLAQKKQAKQQGRLAPAQEQVSAHGSTLVQHLQSAFQQTPAQQHHLTHEDRVAPHQRYVRQQPLEHLRQTEKLTETQRFMQPQQFAYQPAFPYQQHWEYQPVFQHQPQLAYRPAFPYQHQGAYRPEFLHHQQLGQQRSPAFMQQGLQTPAGHQLLGQQSVPLPLSNSYYTGGTPHVFVTYGPHEELYPSEFLPPM